MEHNDAMFSVKGVTMEHNLKCWPEYFQAVKTGAKPFEVRKWDRPYAVGDCLILQEYDPKTSSYTGDSIVRQITYLLDLTYLPGDDRPHHSGYVALGIAPPVSADAITELATISAALLADNARLTARAEKAEAERHAALVENAKLKRDLKSAYDACAMAAASMMEDE